VILYLFLHLGDPTFEGLYLNQQISLPLSDNFLLRKLLVTLADSLRCRLAFSLGFKLFNNGLLVSNHLLLLLDFELQYVILFFKVNHALRKLVDLLGV
jgi:hypothetical protein